MSCVTFCRYRVSCGPILVVGYLTPHTPFISCAIDPGSPASPVTVVYVQLHFKVLYGYCRTNYVSNGIIPSEIGLLTGITILYVEVVLLMFHSFRESSMHIRYNNCTRAVCAGNSLGLESVALFPLNLNI